jgi:hypothetical protein
MEYNTQRPQMLLPEYGRNVQKMITHALEIENREERNLASKAIIEVMGQLNPHLRDEDDYRHKLWTHLFIMSDFKLDVDSPYDKPDLEILYEKPQHMDYPKGNIKFGHYGKYTESILKQTSKEEDAEVKEYLTNTMANFMKKQFLAYNNDAVENNVIAQHLSEITNGELTLENPDSLMQTNHILRTMGKNNPNNRRKNMGGKNNQNNKFKFKKKY